jgi:hypothetical protein
MASGRLQIDPAFPHHEEPPLGGVSNGDFAQDEDEFFMAGPAHLILSEVEGRTTLLPDSGVLA